MMPIIRRAWFLAWFALCPCWCHGEDQPFLAGYLDYPQLTGRLHTLAEREGVTLRTLGQTLGGREIHQVTLGGPDEDSHPAILIVAGLEPRHALGTELAVRLAEFAAAKTDLLKRCTFYVIPCANPDGSARLWMQPFRDPVGNQRPTDDDRDGEFGEDPPEDLDADGFLTSIRVYRTGGAYRKDDEDQRLDTKPDTAEGKFGEYDLYSEGIDNDHDDAWNEDAGDGVDLDRNFSFQYQAHRRNVGDHPVSEIESRAIADFAWDHPNIVCVWCLGPDDNLVHPWAAKEGPTSGRVKTSIEKDDAPLFALFSKRFKEHVPASKPSAASAANGDFLHWGYFHYGRWSIGSPGWTIPDISATSDARNNDKATGKRDDREDKPDRPQRRATDEDRLTRDKPGDETRVPDSGPPPPTPRGGPPEQEGPPPEMRRMMGRFRPRGGFRGRPGVQEDERAAAPAIPRDTKLDRQALKWMDQQSIKGFSDWKIVEHPDFPGQKVEVGGFRSLWRFNPPADQLDTIAEQHHKFLLSLCELLPTIKIDSVRLEKLGQGVMRLTARVANLGYLPTSTRLGADGDLTFPVQVELIVPDEVEILSQPRRHRHDYLAGGGSAVEQTWLIRASDPPAGTVTIRAASTMVGSAESIVSLAGDS